MNDAILIAVAGVRSNERATKDWKNRPFFALYFRFSR